MPRSRTNTLTEREAQIMDVVWRLGTATAEQVREALPDRPHDSTVRTLLRVLESKGYVARNDRGTAYAFRALVDRAKAQRTAIRGLLERLFGGSAEDLVLRMVEDEQISPEQLEEIRQTVRSPPAGKQQHASRGHGGLPDEVNEVFQGEPAVTRELRAGGLNRLASALQVVDARGEHILLQGEEGWQVRHAPAKQLR